MASTNRNKVKKNWWPLVIAISSATTLILFQNCSRVQILTQNSGLTNQSSSNRDANDDPLLIPPTSESTSDQSKVND